MKQILMLIFAFILSASCVSTSKNKKSTSTDKQLELQEDLQRFYTRFTERIVETTFKNQSIMVGHEQDALREYLLYDSEALKIATAPFPVVNLLDMLVFIKLNKIVVRDYWVPEVYGEAGKHLLTAFEDSEKDLEQLASKQLTPAQLAELNNYIHDWRADHPDQIRVEKLRVADFSKYAKTGNKTEKGFSLVDTASAVEAVDQMILVANRGIFLAQQLPLIVRLHTRLGTKEIMSDTIRTFQSAPKLIHELNQTNTLVENLTELAMRTDNLANDSRALLDQMPKSFKGGINVNQGLIHINSMLENSSHLIKQLRSQQPMNKKLIHDLRGEFHGLIWFLAMVIVLVAFLVSAFWWTGSYLSKKHLRQKVS